MKGDVSMLVRASSSDEPGTTSRRRFLGGAGATLLAGAGAFLAPQRFPRVSAPAPATTKTNDPILVSPGRRVGPLDPRYRTLTMGFNERWVGSPAYIQLVGSTAQVVDAVREALIGGRRITVRGGGHCYEDFVSANDGGVIIDMSGMQAVYKDSDATFALEGGCSNWNVYQQLFKDYDVTIPGGSCYSVGLGGHVAGGGYGLLSRQFGLTVDYLTAVEVVTVNRVGGVRVVTARKDDRATEDLLWAHTGGGGGNFGIVTRYYFAGLPQPPELVYYSNLAWNWSDITPARFRALLNNYGGFMASHSSPDSPYAGLFSLLKLTHQSAGQLSLLVQSSGSDRGLLDTFLSSVAEGVGPPAMSAIRSMPWLQATQTLDGSGPNQRAKYKSAYMVRPFPEAQVESVYRWLTDPHYYNPQALLQVDSYGCQINTKAPSETAVAQRSSIMKLQYQTYWTDPSQDDYHLGWIRGFYRDVYAATGGVPRSNGVTDGCYVNYPDVDLGPWAELYYKDNYPRLQRVKARWDPNNIFHHRQSIAPA